MLQTSFIFISFVLNSYWIVSEFYPNDTNSIVLYLWCIIVAVENFAHLWISCSAAEDLHRSVCIFFKLQGDYFDNADLIRPGNACFHCDDYGILTLQD